MIFSGFFGTVGVFTPRQGCRYVTSFSAAGKIALRMNLTFWIVAGLTPLACRAPPRVAVVPHPTPDVPGHDLVHPHGPNPRRDVLPELVGVALRGGDLHHVRGEPPLGDVPVEGLSAPPRVAEAPLG